MPFSAYFVVIWNTILLITNIPVLLNTSFNIKGEPIVNDIDDALRCFKKYNIDFLVINENLILKK